MHRKAIEDMANEAVQKPDLRTQGRSFPKFSGVLVSLRNKAQSGFNTIVNGHKHSDGNRKNRILLIGKILIKGD